MSLLSTILLLFFTKRGVFVPIVSRAVDLVPIITAKSRCFKPHYYT